MRLIAELKRRNVLRAGALYVAAAWALTQGAAQLLPVFNAPEWITRWIVIAAIIGFPLWLAFAWFFELTPSGLKRESDIDPADSVAHATSRKLDFWIIGILALAVVLLMTNQFVARRDATSTADAAATDALATTLATLPEKSVAVLPLANAGGDPGQQYFSDGLSEELISDLTQINGLKVIGKYSSFRFRDSKDSPAQIAVALGVTHLIQGSVREQGGRIHVTVSLIRADDGSNVWSHRYDEQLKDVFTVQNQISEAIATALRVNLMGTRVDSGDRPPDDNVEAYRLMLEGRALVRMGRPAEVRKGITLLKQAVEIDPGYAYAWGDLSSAFASLGGNVTGDEREQAYAKAQIAADKQQALAPDAPATHIIQGLRLTFLTNDALGALAEFKRAYALAPNNGVILGSLAAQLARVGQFQQAADLYRAAIGTDPLRVEFYASLANALLAQRQLDAAEKVVRQALALQPDFPMLHTQLAMAEILRGDAAAALKEANLETDPGTKAWALAAVAQIAPDQHKADKALHDYITENGTSGFFDIAELYALRKQPDEMFEWLERARTGNDPIFTTLLVDPFVLAYQHDPRFAKLCKAAGLPAPGQPLPDTAAAEVGVVTKGK